MAQHSRRLFLTGTGAAALGAVALTSAPGAAMAAGAQDHSRDDVVGTEPVGGEPIVAHVTDVATGEIRIMQGEHEHTVTDRALARRIAKSVG